MKNMLYTSARDSIPTWRLWQKAPGKTRGLPLGFWSRGYRGSEAHSTPTEKEILAAYEGVQAASEVVGTEAQLLLAPLLSVLGWMFKGSCMILHIMQLMLLDHTDKATCSNGKLESPRNLGSDHGLPRGPKILSVARGAFIAEQMSYGMEYPFRQFGSAVLAMSPPKILPTPSLLVRGECWRDSLDAVRALLSSSQNTENEKQYALFTDGSCLIVGKHRRWNAAVWSPTQQVVETAEGGGESSQFAEVKAIQLALDIAEREKLPLLYLYTDSWMVANALWGWLQQWKQSNWQCRGKPIWAAHVPKS
ncbi:hypothetical protein QYF61_001141 [Mycteria americana]|uniref:RNase H type-1 domain-containing protein n=1 Tax=Mycteria americana TaxID=33587 RepID=A0AAN7MAA5_MYCAM|nr:hypothetical protein QYF61_001141 [Mycteria americana]